MLLFAAFSLCGPNHCSGLHVLYQMTLVWTIISYGIVHMYIFRVSNSKFRTKLINNLTVCKYVPGTANDTHPVAPNKRGELALAPEDAMCAI
ncbi:hypothetical protein H9P43_002636 [Blastocladiella emersonii ATCC 22665]|nr:hypothetical protein H9P43_002636 [Blastocladiella emersonii ATCC 22665]